MKATVLGPRFTAIVVAVVLVLSAYEAFGSLFSYDWDAPRDGDILQGWTREPIFGGILNVQRNFGNPGGSMYAIDTRGGGVLYARAPDELSGNLSGYTGVQWDEYILGRATTFVSTFIILQGSDGTRYESGRIEGDDVVTFQWNNRFVPLDDSSVWMLVDHTGTATFEQVISDLDTLFISMDTSSGSSGGRESWVDNFALVPIPGAVWLLGSGLIGLVMLRRKFRKG
ncbi:MAG: VPLPA-CTERM sorting domain-containing protein [Desulfobacterales bacterium]|jgi:hypothetical protein